MKEKKNIKLTSLICHKTLSTSSGIKTYASSEYISFRLMFGISCGMIKWLKWVGGCLYAKNTFVTNKRNWCLNHERFTSSDDYFYSFSLSILIRYVGDRFISSHPLIWAREKESVDYPNSHETGKQPIKGENGMEQFMTKLYTTFEIVKLSQCYFL